MRPPPDLATAEGRAAHARELSLVARPLRWMAYALIAAGLALWLAAPIALRPVAITVLVFGGLNAIGAVAVRLLFHRRRMTGE